MRDWSLMRFRGVERRLDSEVESEGVESEGVESEDVHEWISSAQLMCQRAEREARILCINDLRSYDQTNCLH